MKSKIIKVVTLSIAIILTIFGIFNLIKSDVKVIEGRKTETKAEETVKEPVLSEGEIDPNKYRYDIDTGKWYVYRHREEPEDKPTLVPINDNYEQIFCIEPGSYTGDSEKLVESWNIQDILRQGTFRGYCGHAKVLYEDYTIDAPYYESLGTFTLPRAMAYIVSADPLNKWTVPKQKALYTLRKRTVYNSVTGETEPADGDLMIGDGESRIEDGVPTEYDQPALDYAEYEPSVREKGLQSKNITDMSKVTDETDQKEGKITVGPFKVSYTNGIYGDITFAGISEMKAIGYDKEDKKVRDNIVIEKIILTDMVTGIKEPEQTPLYFEPDKDLKVDTTEQLYPASEQEFWIVIKDPNKELSGNDDKRVASISLEIKFKYMLANGKYTKYKGIEEKLKYTHSDIGHVHRGGVSCFNCVRQVYIQTRKIQFVMSADAIRSIYEEVVTIGAPLKPIPPPPPEKPEEPKPEPPEEPEEPEIPIKITMNLGGHVWEDGVATKETKADGISSTTGNIDKPLKNVKVTLYTSDGKIASLLSNPKEEGLSPEKIMHRVNPTYTDEKGNYLFEGLDSMKKYYVTFEYNGQVYLPTEYLNIENTKYTSVSQMVNAGLYNTNEWKVTSKGTETPKDRQDYDNKFSEIRSYPENYVTSNSLGKSTSRYNASYSQKDLMGYTLDREGKYKQTTTQLIDGYLYDEAGNETNRYRQGIISTRVREYVTKNKKFPDANAMKSIYTKIAGNNTELWRKLQFIEDCQILSYTQSQGKPKDLYPVYDRFKINRIIGDESFNTAEELQNKTYDMKSDVLNGVTYKPLYNGQLFVNQGLWRRQEFDSAMKKDVYRAVMKINSKTVMYKYDKRVEKEGDWDINIRMSDYDKYYNTGYNREVYRTDYEYNHNALNHPGEDLEIYVTYKITIRNQSQSIMAQIKEVVDYYDQDYTYRDDLSWVTYEDGNKNNSVTDDEYYAAMEVAPNEYKASMKEKLSTHIPNARDTKASTAGSKYGISTHSDITKTQRAVYVKGLEDKKLAKGESAYIYLTFQVNKNEEGKVILDDETSPKQNVAEINGYVTYYREEGTSLPNGINKNSNDIAGLLDRDSNPGNLVQSDIADKDDRYEKNFEDDTDRAKSLRVKIYEDAKRKVNGTVWEDQRTGKTEKSGDAVIGDGIRDDKETKVAGVTVQLVEKTVNGEEYIWQEIKTDEDGKYEFVEYIPGNYVVRFYYGNTEKTVKVKGNTNYTAGGENDVSYNGQDFKSTTYQKGIEQNGYTDKSNIFTGYTDVQEQNETGKYGYNIYKEDSNKNNVSDAKDLWSVSYNVPRTYKPNATISERKVIHGRESVINYSNKNVTNHKAEVLASPYEVPSYNGIMYDRSKMDTLINELISNTYMTAETGVIAVEFEYDRQQTDGLKVDNANVVKNDNNNQINGNYTLANIDLGITERPKAQLELDKSIANIKVTLANNTVLFDVNKAADNVIWKPHAEYNIASKKDKDGKYKDFYGEKNKNRYSYRAEVVNDLVDKTDKGLIQLTMDEELMHGATIEITYKLKVTNVGEVDYVGQRFYYLGEKDREEKPVTTQANQVVDYVANNLQFNSNNTNNARWSVITAGQLKADGLVNNELSENLNNFNNIIQTEGLNTALKPGDSTEKILILTQLITTENTSDDLTYNNLAEIAKTSNEVGRRMAYSVVGNQDPTLSKASELDANYAEKVIILPPFGNAHIYYILGIVVAVILISGIAIIIKKVLKK